MSILVVLVACVVIRLDVAIIMIEIMTKRGNQSVTLLCYYHVLCLLMYRKYATTCIQYMNFSVNY